MRYSVLNKLLRSPSLGELAGGVLAQCVRTLARTYRQEIYPPDAYSMTGTYAPCIIATWHGQSYALAAVSPPTDKIKVLISRSNDGQILARTIRPLGFQTIRGSGAHDQPKAMFRKGGLAAFDEMSRALKEGYSIAMTADVPKKARVAGMGIIKLALQSRRPIVPVAVTTSYRRVLRNWDRTSVNLPFGRLVVVVGKPIFVREPNDGCLEKRKGALERQRLELEQALDSLNLQALHRLKGTVA
jgi:lysophospholipid acyltransferase (LPLAT)-like uncharacterized protein